MGVIYANKIIKEGQWEVNPFTIDNVNDYFRQATLDSLTARGYDGYGRKL